MSEGQSHQEFTGSNSRSKQSPEVIVAAGSASEAIARSEHREVKISHLREKELTLLDQARQFGGNTSRAMLAVLFLTATVGCFGKKDVADNADTGIPVETTKNISLTKEEKESMHQFRQEMQELIVRWRDLEFKGVTVDIASDLDSASIKSALTKSLGTKVIVSNFKNPLEATRHQASQERELFNPSAEQLIVYQIKIQRNGNVISVVLENWFTQKIIFAKDLEEPGDGELWVKLKEALQKDRSYELPKALDEYTKSINLSVAEQLKYFHVREGGLGIKELQKIVASGYEITILVMSPDKRVTGAGNVEVQIKKEEDLAEYDSNGTIELNGNASQIRFRKSVNTTRKDTNEERRMVTDTFGNLIKITRFIYNGKEHTTIDIAVPTPRTTTEHGSAQRIAVNINLADYGIEIKNPIAYHEVQTPIKTIGNHKYFVFSTARAKEIKEGIWDKQLGEISNGLEKIETYFGLPPTAIIKNIQLLEGSNSHYDPRDRDTIFIVFDDLQKEEDGNYAGTTAEHETSHLVYSTLGLDEDEVLKKFHAKLGSAFTDSLSEHAWFQDENKGGHAADNHKEMFASFIVGLGNADAIDRLPKKYRQLYVKVCDAYITAIKQNVFRLKSFIKDRGPLPLKLPILDKIEEVRARALANK